MNAPKAATTGLVAYELTALLTGRVPTLTQVCSRYKPLGPVLIAALAVHLYRAPRPVPPDGRRSP